MQVSHLGSQQTEDMNKNKSSNNHNNKNRPELPKKESTHMVVQYTKGISLKVPSDKGIITMMSGVLCRFKCARVKCDKEQQYSLTFHDLREIYFASVFP